MAQQKGTTVNLEYAVGGFSVVGSAEATGVKEMAELAVLCGSVIDVKGDMGMAKQGNFCRKGQGFLEYCKRLCLMIQCLKVH